ncbi:hypothetical protein I4F81_007490 [Pyropia yezoensis]|uniref:Uncharacterized protein n=1 Tax=Pyropia yezoensis TaxID=2788 RepID=A0ACC3C4S6_PYRYE|nr:hypothetical protein I4F81_007490 [Neopyropia yezoensis]
MEGAGRSKAPAEREMAATGGGGRGREAHWGGGEGNEAAPAEAGTCQRRHNLGAVMAKKSGRAARPTVDGACHHRGVTTHGAATAGRSIVGWCTRYRHHAGVETVHYPPVGEGSSVSSAAVSGRME